MDFIITKEIKDKIEVAWGKKISEMDDDDAKEIVEEFLGIDIDYASFISDEEIYYEEYEECEETENNEDVAPGWNENYLNYIGMSMSDFV